MKQSFRSTVLFESLIIATSCNGLVGCYFVDLVLFYFVHSTSLHRLIGVVQYTFRRQVSLLTLWFLTETMVFYWRVCVSLIKTWLFIESMLLWRVHGSWLRPWCIVKAMARYWCYVLHYGHGSQLGPWSFFIDAIRLSSNQTMVF